MRLVQLTLETGKRAVAIPDGDHLRIVRRAETMYDLAWSAINGKLTLADLVSRLGTEGQEDYDRALASGRILPPLDHPEPARFHITGTGLTHLGSAEARSQMHAKLAADDLTDSMRMFKMGLEGGKPAN